MSAGQAKWLRYLLQTLLLIGLAGVSVGWVLLRPSADTLFIVALVALWIFLGIPACCGLKR